MDIRECLPLLIQDINKIVTQKTGIVKASSEAEAGSIRGFVTLSLG